MSRQVGVALPSALPVSLPLFFYHDVNPSRYFFVFIPYTFPSVFQPEPNVTVKTPRKAGLSLPTRWLSLTTPAPGSAPKGAGLPPSIQCALFLTSPLFLLASPHMRQGREGRRIWWQVRGCMRYIRHGSIPRPIRFHTRVLWASCS